MPLEATVAQSGAALKGHNSSRAENAAKYMWASQAAEKLVFTGAFGFH
jgi:hypothetical protein